MIFRQRSRPPIRGISTSDNRRSMVPGYLRDASSAALPSPAVRTVKPSILSNFPANVCTLASSSASKITNRVLLRSRLRLLADRRHTPPLLFSNRVRSQKSPGRASTQRTPHLRQACASGGSLVLGLTDPIPPPPQRYCAKEGRSRRFVGQSGVIPPRTPSPLENLYILRTGPYNPRGDGSIGGKILEVP